MTGAKGAACSERDGVIGPRKRQWPDAGIARVTRGGLVFLPNCDSRHIYHIGDYNLFFSIFMEVNRF
jgi:hypothetical protein